MVGVHGLQGELVGQIEIFLAHSHEIVVLTGRRPVAVGQGSGLQQPCLSHEDGLYLEQIVAVMIHCMQGNALRPLLESAAVDAESVVACQRHEVGRLPGAAALLHPTADGFCLLLQPLGLQRAHPAVHHEAGQGGDDFVTGRVTVLVQQGLVVVGHCGRNIK